MVSNERPHEKASGSRLFGAKLNSPIGVLFVVKSQAGIRRIAFEDEDIPTVILDEQRITGCTLEMHSNSFDDERAQLELYFDGRLRAFRLALDLPQPGFSARAQSALATIPYGETRSYGQLAALAGNARAARAAGTACQRNPLPVILPCHRVLPAHGGVGQYSGLVWRKEFLLALEQHVVNEGER